MFELVKVDQLGYWGENNIPHFRVTVKTTIINSNLPTKEFIVDVCNNPDLFNISDITKTDELTLLKAIEEFVNNIKTVLGLVEYISRYRKTS